MWTGKGMGEGPLGIMPTNLGVRFEATKSSRSLGRDKSVKFTVDDQLLMSALAGKVSFAASVECDLAFAALRKLLSVFEELCRIVERHSPSKDDVSRMLRHGDKPAARQPHTLPVRRVRG